MNVGHFIKVCVCGRVLSQCRCPGPKTRTVVEPCVHEAEPQVDEPTTEPEEGA